MSALISFSFDGARVRTTIEGWFVAADVCAVLEISDVRQAVERLDDDERGVCAAPTPGGMQEMRCISESGLYSLILTSRKPALNELFNVQALLLAASQMTDVKLLRKSKVASLLEDVNAMTDLLLDARNECWTADTERRVAGTVAVLDERTEPASSAPKLSAAPAFMEGKALCAKMIELAIKLAAQGDDAASMEASYRGPGVPQNVFTERFFEQVIARPEWRPGFLAALASHLKAAGNAGEMPHALRELTYEACFGGPSVVYQRSDPPDLMADRVNAIYQRVCTLVDEAEKVYGEDVSDDSEGSPRTRRSRRRAASTSRPSPPTCRSCASTSMCRSRHG